MELKPYTISAGICLLCAITTGGFAIARNQAAVNADVARIEALRQVNNYRKADKCWSLETSEPLTIGTVITLPAAGKSPTLCFTDNRGSYAYAAYLKNQLQVLYIFSQTEANKGVPNG